jgi:glycosyltransferase involved in cell wall biosynthesis
VHDLRDTSEFRAYERVRDAVLAMKQHAAGGVLDPSVYWAEELGNIDYMIEASPLIVRKLRHHAFHITGIRPYDYRDKEDGRRENFTARLTKLRELGGAAVEVPESPRLGGFGYDIDGRLFNVDTIKFNEVLVGMQRGGVLDEIRQRERPVVCEIGAGWGGFAYQFKTLFPRTTYVIVDFAEVFLFSATYLSVLFPEAKILFCGTAEQPSLDQWRDADFVFVPHTLASQISALPLDLVVNMVSFQEMTHSQVEEYVALAAAARCPLLYSFNRDASLLNEQIGRVSDALATRYRLSEVSVLDTDYTNAMRKPPKPGKAAPRTELGYHHFVGRLSSEAGPAGGGSSVSPRVALGMTLYNNGRHLREALDSLLAQTYPNFSLFLLDDASSDDTEAIAREYAARDGRVHYFRHASRQAMVATWYEVVEIAARECPSATLFAWVSDHDRWHPRWLERLVAQLDADPEAVLAYPVTQRITQTGEMDPKGPRMFDTALCTTRDERWSRICREGVGSGDMVYGLMRLDALKSAGIFRRVLRPDRLLIAEMSLYGRIRQVDEVLWFRRMSSRTSIERQHQTLVVAGDEPKWFSSPPWLQHMIALWQEYAAPTHRPLPISRLTWVRMLALYQFTYGWKHFRKSDTSHWIRRAISRTIMAKKVAKHHFHHFVYNTLVAMHARRARLRRLWRRGVYETAMLTHRLGLRSKDRATRTRKLTQRHYRQVVYRVCLLAHRLGLRGGSGTGSR